MSKKNIAIKNDPHHNYKAIFEHMRMGILIYRYHKDHKAYILDQVNSTAMNSIEVAIEDVVGKPVEDLLPKVKCERLREQLRALALGEKVPDSNSFECSCEVRFQKCCAVKKFPLPNDTFGMTIENIGEKRRLEYKLIQAQKLESVATLAGGVAHDFNNLLGGMYGYLELVKQSLCDKNMEKADFYIDRVFGVHERAKDLARQLMSLSKDKEPVTKLTAVRPLLLESILFSFSGSDTRCVQEIPECIYNAIIDVNQIHQVLQNLLINAQQAIDENGLISIEAQNIEPKDASQRGLRYEPHVSIRVSDNGGGISAEDVPYLFDPFFTTKKEGTGLGLAVCKSIIENHDGKIEVKSEKGVGTEFTIYIPASYECIKKNILASGDTASASGTVLVMDDEEFILEIAGDMLSMLGYQPILVGDGKEAIKKYSDALVNGPPIDAVILDLTIKGGLGGLKTIEKLKTINPNIVALVSSGYTESEIVSDYGKYGFHGVISKPYVVNDLRKALSSVLSGNVG